MVSMAMIENAAIRLPTRNGLAHYTACGSRRRVMASRQRHPVAEALTEVNVFAAGPLRPPLQSQTTDSTQGSPLLSAAGQMPFRLGETGRSTGLFLR